jgi:hypothetical protein
LIKSGDKVGQRSFQKKRALSGGDKVIVAGWKRGDYFIACVIVVSETSSVFEVLN